MKVTDEDGQKGYEVKSLQPETETLGARAISPPLANSGNKSSEGNFHLKTFVLHHYYSDEELVALLRANLQIIIIIIKTLFRCQFILLAGQRPTNWGHHLYHSKVDGNKAP